MSSRPRLPIAGRMEPRPPCADPAYERDNLWDDRRVGESEQATMRRWSQAQLVCHTCPVIDQCVRLARSLSDRTGVWAGRIPRMPGPPKREEVPDEDS